MLRTLDRLMQGDGSILTHICLGKQKWEEIMKMETSNDLHILSKTIDANQFWFENNCSQSDNIAARWQGQEIMALTSIARYYSPSDGFGENYEEAKHVYTAFINSGCSMELKQYVQDIAKLYRLIEDA